VFYVSGTRRLEAAPVDVSAGIAWCNNSSTAITGAVFTALGTGAADTTAMVAGCSTGAGNLARAYAGGGKNDWFLPSKDELNQLYLQRDVIQGFGFAATYYWSSSQNSAGAAWIQDFVNSSSPIATQDVGSKGNAYYVRPIRAF
jgi:hypothetical protein